MTRVRKHRKKQSRQLHKQPHDRQLPFIEHVHELRKRISYVALSIGVFGAVAYIVEHQIISVLLRPAHGQQFIYTSPGGGIDFLFRVCLYAGIIGSIPVIIFQILRYIEPLIKKASVHFIAWGSFVSGVLAIAGILYGYFWGLPAALNFLLHQFVTKQIQPLVTIQSYMTFVMVYMVGSALLFQVPLFLIFINRIKPLKPQHLFRYERHVIVAAVIIAALMNPTPNVLALLFLAGPIILMYQVGIAIIWFKNRDPKSAATVTALLEKDEKERQVRLQRAGRNQPLRQPQPALFAASAPDQTAFTGPPAQLRPRQYATQVVRRPVSSTPRPARFVSDFRSPSA